MSAREAVRAAYAAIAAADRPEVWITLRPQDDALADADGVDARVAAGEELPLAGRTLAVKDNIDAAGLPTTAGCRDLPSAPESLTDRSVRLLGGSESPAVARLRAAGAVVLGKTNLDQFATGLVGTRSPYGAVRDAHRPDHVSGGSSAGSGVAVALGLVDLALGTDTAGSGRVPAAFGGIVGLKPTVGRVPVTGTVPACRSFDCVTVFARSVALADQAAALMAGEGAAGPIAVAGVPAGATDRTAPPVRPWPPDAPLAAPPQPVLGRPPEAQLDALTDAGRAAFARACDQAADVGCTFVEVDISAYLAAGRLLYEGAFVAERHAAVGAFAAAHPDAMDPTVAGILAAAARWTASDLTQDRARLDALAAEVAAQLAPVDALLLPTTTRQPTLEEVAAEPVAANTRLGTYTNGTNLCDLAALAIPAGEADGGRFGVTLLAPAFHDRVLADLGRRLLGEPAVAAAPTTPGIDLLVVGAHRAGQPLHHQLTDRGAAYVATIHTAPSYRLHRLDTQPVKPGLVRVPEDGVPIEGELYRLPPAGLASFLAELPSPMALGQVALEDGRSVVGFLCEPAALDGAEDVSTHGSWLAYLAAAAV